MSESYIKKSLYLVNRLDFERLAFCLRPPPWESLQFNKSQEQVLHCVQALQSLKLRPAG